METIEPDGWKPRPRRAGRKHAGLAVAAAALLLAAALARPEAALIAVAANFAEVMERLEGDFERHSPHALNVTTGSTGKLYAQIGNGAPFDVLLAADQRHPELLEEKGLAVAGSRFTYAIGKLTLWSPQPGRIAADGAVTLRAGEFRRLAIANPDLAPYGAAARQVLEHLGIYQSLGERIVMGENVGQAHVLVATGNAELGLVALSAVRSPRNDSPGSRWDVPQGLHEPIRQDAVLLTRAAANSAARDLLAFLRHPEVRERIREFGYDAD
jgi:molybdate transport system substrate-binding protein